MPPRHARSSSPGGARPTASNASKRAVANEKCTREFMLALQTARAGIKGIVQRRAARSIASDSALAAATSSSASDSDSTNKKRRIGCSWNMQLHVPWAPNRPGSMQLVCSEFAVVYISLLVAMIVVAAGYLIFSGNMQLVLRKNGLPDAMPVL